MSDLGFEASSYNPTRSSAPAPAQTPRRSETARGGRGNDLNHDGKIAKHRITVTPAASGSSTSEAHPAHISVAAAPFPLEIGTRDETAPRAAPIRSAVPVRMSMAELFIAELRAALDLHRTEASQ